MLTPTFFKRVGNLLVDKFLDCLRTNLSCPLGVKTGSASRTNLWSFPEFHVSADATPTPEPWPRASHACTRLRSSISRIASVRERPISPSHCPLAFLSSVRTLFPLGNFWMVAQPASIRTKPEPSEGAACAGAIPIPREAVRPSARTKKDRRRRVISRKVTRTVCVFTRSASLNSVGACSGPHG